MTQEEKKLVLQDLSARLPYGVIGEYSWKGNEPHNRELTGNLYDELNSSWSSTGDSKFIPYLRPMSSMTEEEKMEFINATDGELRYSEVFDVIKPIYESEGYCVSFVSYLKAIDWLNAHHFDYRGLIPKDLAIEVTKENNPYKD